MKLADYICRICKHSLGAHGPFSCIGCLQFAHVSAQVCKEFVADNLAYLEQKDLEKTLKEYVEVHADPFK